MSAYREKLKDPRWQRKRLEIFQRDDYTCQSCRDKSNTLHVHHKAYRDVEPWDYPNHYLVTLCADCHEEESTHMSKMTRGLCDQIKVAGAGTLDVLKLWTAFQVSENNGNPITLRPYQWSELEELIAAYIKSQIDPDK